MCITKVSTPASCVRLAGSAKHLPLAYHLCRCHSRHTQGMHNRPGVWPAELKLELGAACQEGVSRMHSHPVAREFLSFTDALYRRIAKQCQLAIEVTACIVHNHG